MAPRYQQAAGPQKMLLLDQVVELTGYARKYAIRLLNHAPKRRTHPMGIVNLFIFLDELSPPRRFFGVLLMILHEKRLQKSSLFSTFQIQ
jgi:hypothetical protein